MKALVTGVTGFIGRPLALALLSRGDDVVGLSRSDANILHPNYQRYAADLSERGQLDGIDQDFDVVFHLAGDALVKTGGTTLMQSNVMGTFNLLDALASNRPQKFVLASSATVYGDTERPADEEQLPAPRSIYAAAKIACEALAQAKAGTGFAPIVARLVANTGGDATHGVIKDLVAKALREDSGQLEVLGNHPGSRKPFVHVSDTVRALLHLADTEQRGVFNVSNVDTVYVAEIVEMILAATGTSKQVEWIGQNWAGDNPTVCISNAKLLATGFRFQHPSSRAAIAAGVEELCQQAKTATDGGREPIRVGRDARHRVEPAESCCGDQGRSRA